MAAQGLFLVAASHIIKGQNMNVVTKDIKIIYGNLCYAMLRNISNSFTSLSFNVDDQDMIQVKIILSELTHTELNYIDDLIAELSMATDTNVVLEPIVTTDQLSGCLPYVVYSLVT